MSLVIKVDVDTDRGTRVGVPALDALFDRYQVPATFLFSLGPDRTGQAIKRIFRPGFLKKVSRTSVLQVYGLRTLLNGFLLPAPHIGRKNAAIIRTISQIYDAGIHCYDHIEWQDHLHALSYEEVWAHVNKAQEVYEEITGAKAQIMGSAGWQASANSLAVYDQQQFICGSDTRGETPFYPVINGVRYQTLQIPTTLPTLDELLGRPEYPMDKITAHYHNLMRPDRLNVLTIHAELEGMAYLDWFETFLKSCTERGIVFESLRSAVGMIYTRQDIPFCENIPFCSIVQQEIDGRSGAVACQGGEYLDLITHL